MPTREQLYERWDMELNHPWTRHTDDPMYVSPETFIRNQKQIQMEKNHGHVELCQSGDKFYTRTVAENGRVLSYSELLNLRQTALNNIKAELNLYGGKSVKVRDYATMAARKANALHDGRDTSTWKDYDEFVFREDGGIEYPTSPGDQKNSDDTK